MSRSDLKDALLSIVTRHGLEKVRQCLSEMESSERNLDHPHQGSEPADAVPVRRSRKRRPKPTASQYVAKMELSPEKAKSVIELARRFDTKSFLPSFVGDIVGFCERYGVQVPASRSRASAIPRVFKRIESLETEEIRRILDERLFSGPSRLGPIADAIRRNGRAAAGRL